MGQAILGTPGFLFNLLYSFLTIFVHTFNNKSFWIDYFSLLNAISIVVTIRRNPEKEQASGVKLHGDMGTYTICSHTPSSWRIWWRQKRHWKRCGFEVSTKTGYYSQLSHNYTAGSMSQVGLEFIFTECVWSEKKGLYLTDQLPFKRRKPLAEPDSMWATIWPDKLAARGTT